MRQMLLHLGARKDMTVRAGACPGGPNTPSHMIIVDVDFYSLAPAAAGASAGGGAADGIETVNAQWAPVKFIPDSPRFMGDGDCELLQSLKDFISQNFTLRNLEYRTDCFPHTITLNAYSVKAQALKAVPPGGAAKS